MSNTSRKFLKRIPQSSITTIMAIRIVAIIMVITTTDTIIMATTTAGETTGVGEIMDGTILITDGTLVGQYHSDGEMVGDHGETTAIVHIGVGIQAGAAMAVMDGTLVGVDIMEDIVAMAGIDTTMPTTMVFTMACITAARMVVIIMEKKPIDVRS
jgi:hypothetical protein